MPTEELIIGLFVRVDDAMPEVPLHPQLSFLLALFNVLVQWDGLPRDANGSGHRSLASFSL